MTSPSNILSAYLPLDAKEFETSRINKKAHVFQSAAFISLSRHLLPSIRLGWRQQQHENHIPINVVEYLHSQLQMSFDEVHEAWAALSDEILRDGAHFLQPLMPSPAATIKSIDLLYTLKLPARTLGVPFVRCPKPGCGRKLDDKPPIQGSLLTITHGKVPVLCLSVYCKSCNIRLYHNFKVERASDQDATRDYYTAEVPECLEISDHVYADVDFCEWVRMEIAINSSSATNVASMYNRTLSKRWSTTEQEGSVSYRSVLECFFLYSLVLDSKTQNRPLVLPHNIPQQHRLMLALDERNARVASNGLVHWPHKCNECFQTVRDDQNGEEYTISAVVTDGVTVGHPCCSERDCKVPLDKVTDKYCPIHRNLGSVCCVTGCQNPKGSGFLTCKLGSHRKEERRRTENKGRRRRTSGRGVQAEEDIGEGDDAEEERNGVRARHNNGARSVVKGIFSRRWTHNEQLMVRPCGIIIGRATFFSAESMTGVKLFIQNIFPPEFPGIEPTFIFFDNACGLRTHIKACVDHSILRRVALVVDVFHFASHKESHTECQENCSPFLYPVLKKTDGSWLFNSSAAEQANSWFGKFQPKVKEMNVIRYNFFLDEVLNVRNTVRESELRKRGLQPIFLDEKELATAIRQPIRTDTRQSYVMGL